MRTFRGCIPEEREQSSAQPPYLLWLGCGTDGDLPKQGTC